MTVTLPPTSITDPARDPIELLIKEARVRTRRRRLSIAAIAAIAVATTAVAVAISSPTSRSPITSTIPPTSIPQIEGTAAPPCETSALTVTDEGASGGAGSWGDLFRFRNVSRHACSLTGYPKIAFRSSIGLDRFLVEMTRPNFPGFPMGLVADGHVPFANLAPHSGVASFWVTSHDIPVGLGPGQVCHAADEILITPPGTNRTMALGFSRDDHFSWCGPSIGVLPVLSGDSGDLPARPLSYYTLVR
jgi:hypothetical protein